MTYDTEYVLVTEYFHPDTASTGQLMTDLAVGLENRGLDMTVYTSQPNYHSGKNTKQPSTTYHEGVLVKRISAPQVRQSSLTRRLFNWIVFVVWMSLVLLFSRPDRDRELIFVSNPPFLPIVLWPVCRLRGWDYTYIVHDLYPDQPVELNYLTEGGVVARVWHYLHEKVFSAATNVVAIGPAMKERIVRSAGADFNETKVEVIHNWEDEEFIQPVSKSENWFSREHGLVDSFTILYSGNIGEFHDLETLIRAAEEFRNENVKFLIIGEGDNKESIVSLADELGVSDGTVEFLPYQPWDELPYSLTSGDVSVVTVKEGFEGVCVSSKLYTAMAAGMPVLCISQPYDDEAKIVKNRNAGINVPQGDINGVVSAIRRWMEDPRLVDEQGENARTSFEAEFTKSQAIDEYYEMLSD